MPRLKVVLLLVAGALLGAPAHAEDSPQQKLGTVEKQIEESRERQARLAQQAEALGAEIAKLRSDAVAAASAAQAHEAALTELDRRLVELAAEEKQKSAELEHKQAQQTELLMALERLARNPPEGLALLPGEPVDILRGARLMGAALPPIVTAAHELSAEIKALAALRDEIAQAQAKHRAESAALAEAQSRIAGLIARKAALQQRATQGVEQSGRRQVQLAAQAKDLRELIERLEAERKQREEEARQRAEAERLEAERRARQAAPHPGRDSHAVVVVAPPPRHLAPGEPRHLRPFREARGAMVFPASGTLVRRFGEPDDLGVASKGLTIETRPGALIVAPFDGRVEFAGEFKGYGQILIIGHGDGYHSLLAGLDRVDERVGQWLVAGEPVGVMPSSGEQSRLYLELRHNDQPINPLPWLATRDEKVSG